MARGARAPLILALDTGSPTVSVAVGAGGRSLAVRTVAIGRSSESLLRLVEEALAEAGVRRRDLDGVIALQGPGSFTGLRVGLATALALHQALGMPATALPTLEALAAWAVRRGGGDGPSTVLSAVDALRGEWHLQPFRRGAPPAPLGDARLGAAGEARRWAPCEVVGFGTSRLAAAGDSGISIREPDALAPAALLLAAWTPPVWDPGRLVRPLYLRPPAVTSAPRRSAPVPTPAEEATPR